MYFNENDPFAAKWLVQLFPTATVDDRSIVDVETTDVVQFDRCHFFGGIGGWELALRLAGWPKEWPVWTGSCPCQPFSCAGKGKGEDDKRHLWPEFRRLIKKRRPATIFGEQVAGKDGLDWLAGVCADLEALDYAFGAADLCAAGTGTQGEGWIVRGDQADWERLIVSAPHLRQRLYWVADACESERRWGTESGGEHGRAIHIADCGDPGGVADATSPSGSEQRREQGKGLRREAGSHDSPEHSVSRGLAIATNGRCEDGGRISGTESDTRGGRSNAVGRNGTSRLGDTPRGGLRIDGSASGNAGHADESGTAGGMVHAGIEGLEGHTGNGDDGNQSGRLDSQAAGHAPATGHLGAWSRFDLIPCLDEKTRRVESGTFPLADGVPNRVGRLRGYGNAIVVPQAAEFIKAFMETIKAN